jgi:hypothetical protein
MVKKIVLVAALSQKFTALRTLMTNHAREVFCQGRFPASLIYVLIVSPSPAALSMANYRIVARGPEPHRCNRVESRGLDAENKPVTARTFINFRGPQALNDKLPGLLVCYSFQWRS